MWFIMKLVKQYLFPWYCFRFSFPFFFFCERDFFLTLLVEQEIIAFILRGLIDGRQSFCRRECEERTKIAYNYREFSVVFNAPFFRSSCVLYTVFVFVLSFYTSLTEVIYFQNDFVFVFVRDPIKSINRYFALIPFDFYWTQKCIVLHIPFGTRSFAIALSLFLSRLTAILNGIVRSKNNAKWNKEEKKRYSWFEFKCPFSNAYKLCNNNSQTRRVDWFNCLRTLDCFVWSNIVTSPTRLCKSEWVFAPAASAIRAKGIGNWNEIWTASIGPRSSLDFIGNVEFTCTAVNTFSTANVRRLVVVIVRLKIYIKQWLISFSPDKFRS